MGCACSKGQKQVFKVIAADGSSKEFDAYAAAQAEQKKNGGRIRVTYANK